MAKEVNWFKRSNYAVGMDLLNYDMGNLVKPCKETMDAGADYFHVDVQDGYYGPTLTVGSPVIKGIRKHFPDYVIICHMLVEKPALFVEQFAEAGCDCFIFHLEKADDVPALIAQVKATGMKVGIALNEDIEAEAVKPYVKDIDVVEIMCGDPTDDDAEFNGEMLAKIAAVRKLHKKVLIEIEGSVTSKEMEEAVKKGANLVVSGFKGKDTLKEFRDMRYIVNKFKYGL